jgi:hypothetical protein
MGRSFEITLATEEALSSTLDEEKMADESIQCYCC